MNFVLKSITFCFPYYFLRFSYYLQFVLPLFYDLVLRFILTEFKFPVFQEFTYYSCRFPYYLHFVLTLNYELVLRFILTEFKFPVF